MSPIRRAAILLLTTGVALGVAVTPSSSAELPDDDLAAAVEAAGQPATQANPDVRIPQDAGRPVVTTLGDATVTLSLPATGAGTQQGATGQTLVFDSTERGAHVAAEPTSDGVRALVRVDDADAPGRYDFALGGDVAGLELAEDGSVSLLDADGLAVGEIDTPWARDAEGREVATHYEVSGMTLTQVVEHAQPGVAYPVVADPRVFRCDLYVNWCVKFTKSETKSISYRSYSSIGVFAGALCGYIPNRVIAAGCTAGVAAVGSSLKSLFRNAAQAGRCAQIHFTNGGIPIRWKSVTC